MNAQNTNPSMTELFGEVISRYTRAQAIEDGFLADISPLAKEYGIIYPVAISNGITALVEDAVNKGGKDFNGVVWDILTMLKWAIKNAGNTSRLDFSVRIWNKHTGKDKVIFMYAVCGAGDALEPVITIMLPNED